MIDRIPTRLVFLIVGALCFAFACHNTNKTTITEKQDVAGAIAEGSGPPAASTYALLRPEVDNYIGIFVDPVTGSNSNPGTMQQPLASLQWATDRAFAQGKVVFAAGGSGRDYQSTWVKSDIYCGYQPGTWARDPSKYVSSIGGTRWFGLAVDETRTVTIDSCNISGGGPTFSYSAGLRVRGKATLINNKIDGGNATTKTWGVRTGGPTDCEVTAINNIITSGAPTSGNATGFVNGPCSSLLINNTIVASGGDIHSIAFNSWSGSVSAELVNNIFYAGGSAVENWVIAVDYPSKVSMTNNLLFGPTLAPSALLLNHNSGVFTRNNDPAVINDCASWPDFCLSSSANLTDDPLFIDAPSGDYYLDYFSPARDAGLDPTSQFPIASTGYDQVEFVRPENVAWDIGAYEYRVVCLDADGDGYGIDCNRGIDCDDSDDRRYPDAPDPPDDGLDFNCDGLDPSALSDPGIYVNWDQSNCNGRNGSTVKPYCTIQEAIDSSSAGDNIYVSEGIYSEVDVTTDVNIYGGYSAAAAWARNSKTYATSIISGTIDTPGILTQNLTSLEIDGLTIVGGGGSTTDGIFAFGNLKMSNCNVSSGSGSFRNIGINIWRDSDSVITNSVIQGENANNFSYGLFVNGRLLLYDSVVTGGTTTVSNSIGINNNEGELIAVRNRITSSAAATGSQGVTNSNIAILVNNLIITGYGSSQSVGVNEAGVVTTMINNTVIVGDSNETSKGVSSIAGALALVNNIFDLGSSPEGYGIFFMGVPTEPKRLVRNNIFHGFDYAFVLYGIFQGRVLEYYSMGTINECNGYPTWCAIGSKGNVDGDPLFINADYDIGASGAAYEGGADPFIQNYAGIGATAPQNFPSWDYQKEARPNGDWDIGYDEYTP